MKNHQKGSIVPLLLIIIAVLVIGGGFYIYKQQSQTPNPTGVTLLNPTSDIIPKSQTSTSTKLAQPASPIQNPPADNTPEVSVGGMQQYTDSTFGFSFWYPSSWTLTKDAVTSTDDNGWFQGGAIRGQVTVHAQHLSTGVTIQEFHSSSLDITELGQTKSASPVGVDQKYFFDPSTHVWMYENLTDWPSGSRPGGTITAADISNNTMGGLHIFSGAKRFGADSIVPLSGDNFLVISTNDPGGGTDQKYLVNTVTATNPAVATPVSDDQQVRTIQVEMSAYSGLSDIFINPSSL